MRRQTAPANNPLTPRTSTRRAFVRKFVAGGLATGAAGISAQSSGKVAGFDHVALPMQNTEAMLAFYRKLGFAIRDTANAVSVYVGSQMINFHRPALWQSASFTL